MVTSRESVVNSLRIKRVFEEVLSKIQNGKADASSEVEAKKNAEISVNCIELFSAQDFLIEIGNLIYCFHFPYSLIKLSSTHS